MRDRIHAEGKRSGETGGTGLAQKGLQIDGNRLEEGKCRSGLRVDGIEIELAVPTADDNAEIAVVDGGLGVNSNAGRSRSSGRRSIGDGKLEGAADLNGLSAGKADQLKRIAGLLGGEGVTLKAAEGHGRGGKIGAGAERA